MTTKTIKAAAAIRARIDHRAKATRAKDVASRCFRSAAAPLNWAVHDHRSVPFDPQTGKAMLDLTPEHAERASAA
jgi:hypothetical protein